MKFPRFFIYINVVLFVIIVVLPIVFSIIAPFFSQECFSNDGFFEQRHLSLAKNSILLATGTTVISLLVGVPLAFFLSRTNVIGSKFFRIIYLIPILISPFIHAIVWNYLSEPLKNIFFFDIHSLLGAIFVLTLAYFPFVTLMTMSGLQSIDRRLEETSLLCHGAFKTVKRITLPLTFPHIFSGALFVFIFSIIDFGVPDILRVRVYPVEIFIQFSALYNERAASLLSLPLIAVTIFLIFLQRWYMKDRSYINVWAGKEESITYNLGKYQVSAFIFCCIVFVFSVFIPVAVLAQKAGGLSNYAKVISTSRNQISYSFIFATFGSLAALFIAFPISYLIERVKTKRTMLLEFATLVPFAIPAATLGIGFIKVWNRPVIDVAYNSFVIIILAYVARFVPFSIRAVSSGIKQINLHLEEVGILNVNSWMKVMRQIILPLCLPSLVAGFFIVFILSFGELGTTLLIIPPGKETIIIKIYNLMHYGADQMVAALSLILIVIMLTFGGIFLLIYKRLNRKVHA